MIGRPLPFFLPASGGEQRLCIFHPPAGETRAKVLYLHPFAEEMNKARHMAALGARALAQAGFATLQIDLRGCGDSSADFGQASWFDWQQDVRLGLEWLDEEQPDVPVWLWGLRAGCLLAATDWGRPVHHLFWQPALSGKLALQQFLRLRLAAEMANPGSKGLMERLKAELAAGRAVEVAGYSLGAALASGLDAARLTPSGTAGRVEWLELSPQPDAALAPTSQATIESWRSAGWTVRSRVLQGPAFWGTTEIELAPELIVASVEALA